MSKINHFKYYKTSPKTIKLAVMHYVRYPLSLRQVEDILHERGIDVRHETIRYWWNKFGGLFSIYLARPRYWYSRHLGYSAPHTERYKFLQLPL